MAEVEGWWRSDSPLLAQTYRRYRDLLHIGSTLDAARGASSAQAPAELRAVGLLLRASAATQRLDSALVGLADVRDKVAALAVGWGPTPAYGDGESATQQPAGSTRARAAGLCDLPSDVTGRILQQLGAIDLSHMRQVCRKSRAVVDLWEPELWRSLVAQEFIPEEAMSRLLSDAQRAAACQRLPLWSSWKRVYSGLHKKVCRLPTLERQARILEAKPKDNVHWRRKACTPEDVERKRLAVFKQVQTMRRTANELDHKRAALSQMRKAAQAELSLYQSDGRWDPTDIQIHVEAMGARQLQEERRCADKLRQSEQLRKLQASASQGLQAILLKLAQVRCNSEEIAEALQSVTFRSRTIDAPTDAIGMIELQLLAMLKVIESGDVGDGVEGGVDMPDGGRPQSPESVGSDTSSDTSPSCIRHSRLAEIEEVQAPDSPPPLVRSTSEAAEVAINLHLGDFPALGRMRPVQWAIELGACEPLRCLLRASAQPEFEDAWHRSQGIAERLKNGKRLLFADALMPGRETPHQKLLRLLNGDELAPPSTEAPTVSEPARAVGRWMGSPHHTSSASARRERLLQMQDENTDSESESDPECEPISLEDFRAAARLAATDRQRRLHNSRT